MASITKNKAWQVAKNILQNYEYKHLLKYPRYKEGTSKFLLRDTVFSDASTFLEGYNEIIKEGIYRFTPNTPTPFIIDCGANIGLATIFFKKNLPNSEIVAVEPDPSIYKILERNVIKHKLQNVTLINKAIWSTNEKTLSFIQEGGFSGRLRKETKERSIPVGCITLKELIKKPVDFLKIDIEGAENEIFHHIKDELRIVKNLFLEYHSIIGKEQKLGEILTTLSNLGYRYQMSSAYKLMSPYIYENKIHDMDMQINIFAKNEKF